LPAGGLGGIAEDSSGRVVAGAEFRVAHVLTPDRQFHVGPLDDCREVALSPAGQWLAAGSHGQNGAQVWRIADGARVADLKEVEGLVQVAFSPDGRWLMTSPSPCRLWSVGTWDEARRFSGEGYGFSPDGRYLLVLDSKRVLHLVEPETGRTVAGLESPDSCSVKCATFSPDGLRLAVITNDGPAVHVWDLRRIRKRLAGLGLDWDAPPYPAADPADPSAPPLPPLQVELDPLDGHIEPSGQSPEELVALHTQRIGKDPEDAESYHQRGHALVRLQRFPEALEDLNRAIRLRPGDMHLRVVRAAIDRVLSRFDPAIADLEAVLAGKPDQPAVQDLLALCCNNRAWELTTGPESTRDAGRALRLARRATELAPDEAIYINTLGVAEYRAGRFAEAIATLERSLAGGGGQFDAFDLFFLAMAHHRLAHRQGARGCFDRAVKWLAQQKGLNAGYADELARFRAEAEAVLAGPTGELPDDVFAPARPGR
jgi:tetratricopeptide (TPR) repeat protein